MARISLRTLSASSLPIPGADPWYAAQNDPALTVMTDFRERPSVVVPETASIDVALDHMKHNGVRCAFAVDEARRVVVGLVTSYDITGDRPVRFMQDTRTRRRDVLVRDIMQPIVDWQVADIRDIEQSTVGGVSRLFDEMQVSHIPVMESGAPGEPRLRGLLSAAKVRRLLSRPPVAATG